jgi:RNA polymerase-binding transcription factor DksA
MTQNERDELKRLAEGPYVHCADCAMLIAENQRMRELLQAVAPLLVDAQFSIHHKIRSFLAEHP